MATEGQQHPIKLYFLVWILLFVFSAFSYAVDALDFQGMARWFLIIVFMLLKAGFIVAVFMHMSWERPALYLAILVPPVLLLVLMYLMAMEADYAWATRIMFYDTEMFPEPNPPPSHAVGAH